MVRRRSRRGEPAPNGSWIRDAGPLLTGVAAIATVMVTGFLGWMELTKDTTAMPAPSTQASRTSPAANTNSSGSAAADLPSQPANAPPANAGGGAATTPPPPIVSVTTFGWEADVLRVDGTVSGRSGPLWVAVQPIEADPSVDPWTAAEMAVGGGDAEPEKLADWSARFFGAARADRYRIKVFQESYGFGAGGAPDDSYERQLEEGGAAEPSDILDIQLDVDGASG